MNPDYRTESRRGWGAVAGGWKQHAPAQREAWMPVSAWMLDAARLQPGMRVLELATGTGELGLMAHELIQPGGELLLSDFAPEMLSAAQENAGDAPGVRFKQIDIESIDVEAASQDAVLCRWGLMFLADREAGAREIRRVLRPGGRFVTAAWTTAEENPWSSVVGRVLGETPEPGAPGQFALGAEGALEELLAGAGFVEDLEVEAIDVELVESFADWWERTTVMSRIGAALRGREDEVRAALSVYEHDGLLRLPGRTWVAAATA
jgi:ubiquinone/menaquinone biosynthesis C-methylase UbiE